MSSNEETLFAAQIDKNIHVIDLHNTTLISEALEQLEQQLFFCYQKDIPYCRVVHGIGEGILQKHVHNALEKNPMVADYHLDGGSTIVIL